MKSIRWWIMLALGGLLVPVAVGGTWHLIDAWRYRSNLDQAHQEMARGRYASARERLTRLATRWPDQGEVLVALGDCELAEGRPDEALRAWSRVPVDSSWAARAAVRQARVLEARGRLAQAEAVLVGVSDRGGPDVIEVRQALVQLYRKQGRTDEAIRLLHDSWEHDPVAILQLLGLYETERFPVEGFQRELEDAWRRAPDDDRVWLGLAHMATRSGRLAEAQAWLDACRQRRPNDPAVWRAWLDWAHASANPDEARRALAWLPDPWVSRTERLSWHAWFAQQAGDPKAEEQALALLVTEDPSDTVALERLADLALQAGQIDRAREFRQRKAAIDQARDRYQVLIQDQDPVAHAEELIRLAETLGRRFEARCWASLGLERDPTRPEAREALARLERSETERRQRLDRASDPMPSGLAQALVPDASATPDASDDLTDPPRARLHFDDEAEAAGLRFVYHNGQTPDHHLPETMGGGVALLDYDGDGWLDVYVVQGGLFPPPDDAPNADRLFRNNGDGTFTDVTESAGLSVLPGGYGHGVTVGDYDNDGHPDLFVTRWRSYALYRNNGDGTFEDVTAQVGLDGDRDWPTSAAFADFDGDGHLDLYVCHYLVWEPGVTPPCRRPGTNAPMYCDPRGLPSCRDRFYHNDGGRFVEVTEEAGITAPDGRGLGVVAADLDGDGLVDLYVANDETANFFYRNRGGMRFEEVGHEAGVAAGAEGGYQAGMGLALGDFDGDGRPDLVVTNFYGESSTYYQNLGGGLFLDRTAPTGLKVASRLLVGFGVAFLDADNDGVLDLASTNGHVNDFRPLYPYAMPCQLLLGSSDGRFVPVSDRAGPVWQVPRVGRGLAVGDLDNSGRLDLVILAQNEPLALFRNHTEQAGHFVTLKLEGTTSNRDAIGAVVTVEAGGRRQTGFRYGGGSYQSANDPRLHFGLGESDRVEAIAVRWPSGQVDRYEDLPADTGYHLIEGDPEPKPLKGFDPGVTKPVRLGVSP